jgi:hypothetical protein
MFRVLLAHPQEVLNKKHLVYCICIMSVDCGTVAVPAIVPPEDEQPSILNKLNEKCITLVSVY